MKKQLLLLLALLPLTAFSQEDVSTIFVHLIEIKRDGTAAGRRFATFQDTSNHERRFTFVIEPRQEATDLAAHNTLCLIRSFPLLPKDRKEGDFRAPWYYKPKGVLAFEVPIENPEKKLSEWKISQLQFHQDTQGR